MYKIIDLEGDNGYSLTKEIFETKREIIKILAEFHNDDYDGVKANDGYYKDIFEFLDTLKSEEDKLNWLLDYGQWEIEEIKSKCCNAEIINHGCDIVDFEKKSYHLECKKCNTITIYIC